MLGLSLAIRVGKRVLGGLIDSLMSAVKGRATYSENIADSKQVLKDIDNYELLDKATILLTPTATSDARVHCVKPSLPDYGKNLIPNSDDADSWTIVTNSGTIVNENGYLKLTDTSGSYGYAYIPITVETGKDYIITYNLVDSGTTSSNYARIGNGVNQSTYHSENNFNNTGKRTVRISPTATTIYITLISGIGVSKYAYWTDVTVQATADFDFDRASSATRINSDGLVQDMQSITDPELVQNGDFEELGDEEVTNGTFDTDSNWSNTGSNGISISDGKFNFNDTPYASNSSQNNVTTVGKTYKVVFTVSDYVKGNVRIFLGGSATSSVSANGTYTNYVTASANTSIGMQVLDGNGTTLSIDNVSYGRKCICENWSFWAYGSS